MTLKETQKVWQGRVDRAKKVRTNWKELFRVAKLLMYFDGRQNPGFAEEDWITINLIYSHLKAQLPALYDTDPYFYINLARYFKPVTPSKEGITAASEEIAAWDLKGKMRAANLNYYKKELDLKTKARLAIQDAHFAYGVIKTHFTADGQENPDAGQPIISDEGVALTGEDGTELIEPEEIPVNQRYNITRVHFDDFLWDEDAGPLEDSWGWVAQRIRMTPEQALQNPKYKKRAVKAMFGKGSALDDEEKTREDRKKGGEVSGNPEDPKKKDKKNDIFIAWEIYDLKNHEWLVIAEDGEIPLMDAETIPIGIEKHPYSILQFTPRDDSAYGIPPLSQGVGLQEEYNKARSDIQVHRKRFNRKYEYVEGAVAPEEVSKMESGEDGSMVAVKQFGAINPIKDAILDQSRYTELGFIKAEFTETTGGSTPEARGIAGADSATQAGILDKRLDIKEGDAKAQVLDFIKSIARKLDQLIQANITEDQAVKVSGPEGERWKIVRTTDYDEIAGEYEYDVNVGATLPRLPQIERSSWMAFLAFLGNAPQFALSPRLLKKAAEMHHIEDEAMLQEIQKIAEKMMGGQLPVPGAQGSQPGVGETRPQSEVGGQVGGNQSLALPLAGNAQE
jgi:hypothetical protein